MAKVLLEVCVDTPASLQKAKAGGADRVELCSALEVGGLTPCASFMRFAADMNVQAHVMIRPRAGDFCFDSDEVQLMLCDIAQAKALKLQGVVLGASHQDGTIDISTLKKLIAAAKGMDITLHRAFDLTPDPFKALEQAVELGFHRILTSGQQPTSIAGQSLIKQLHTAADGRIDIMPGSGVNAKNVQQLLDAMPLKSVHASCSEVKVSAANKVTALGFEPPAGRRETSVTLVEELVGALN